MFEHLCVSIDDDPSGGCLGAVSDHYHFCSTDGKEGYWSDHCCRECGCRQHEPERVELCEVTDE